MAGGDSVAVPVLGYISVVCWCLIFCPQLWQNYKLAGTVGLSLSTFLLWGFTGFAAAAFIVYQHGDISLVIQWLMMSTTSFGVVFQIYWYNTFKNDLSLSLRFARASLVTLCWVAGSIGWLVGALYLFRAEISPAVPLALGAILPSVTVAVGFFPQIWEFYKVQGGEAYSSMLAWLDITGCICGMAVWILQGNDNAGLIPYIVILCLQLVMLFLKHVWFRRSAACKNPAAPPYSAEADPPMNSV
jgi:hypothetical protein